MSRAESILALRGLLDSHMGLMLFLDDQLGRTVARVTLAALKPRMCPVVEREAVEVL